jgi:hypothetical protein
LTTCTSDSSRPSITFFKKIVAHKEQVEPSTAYATFMRTFSRGIPRILPLLVSSDTLQDILCRGNRTIIAPANEGGLIWFNGCKRRVLTPHATAQVTHRNAWDTEPGFAAIHRRGASDSHTQCVLGRRHVVCPHSALRCTAVTCPSTNFAQAARPIRKKSAGTSLHLPMRGARAVLGHCDPSGKLPHAPCFLFQRPKDGISLPTENSSFSARL